MWESESEPPDKSHSATVQLGFVVDLLALYACVCHSDGPTIIVIP